MNQLAVKSLSNEQDNKRLFESIALDLLNEGFSINPLGLPHQLACKLQQHANDLSNTQFSLAGVGRDDAFMHNQFVRNDSIYWIDGNCDVETQWLKWIEELKSYLNQKLLLGLFSFESHFAWYQQGQFYKRHVDAFRGEANRILSVVVYLNNDWQLTDGGELVLYRDEQDVDGIKVLPRFATVAVFLSEEFPHEVLPASRDRLSIAGWFRVNQSLNGQIDPPK